jgi:oligoribonuclease NrnB/cAMP/cGMP phosphodiesterase (DHH superfamily)
MIYVISHKSCADGYGAAWAAWKKFGDSAKYLFKHYGDEVGYLEPNSEIYITDFSFPRDVLLGLVEAGHTLKVLDHHKTAEEALAGLPFAHFDLSKSGARLSWEFFHPEEKVPKLILAVEDRDLWAWKYPDTKAIGAYLSSIAWTFDAWTSLSQYLEDPETYKSIYSSGLAIMSYQDQIAEDAAKKAYNLNISGYTVKGLNQTTLISETGNKILIKHPDTPFSATFFVAESGEYIFSLRGRGDFNVSAVAKIYGGGGHKSAAGFKVSSLAEAS